MKWQRAHKARQAQEAANAAPDAKGRRKKAAAEPVKAAEAPPPAPVVALVPEMSATAKALKARFLAMRKDPAFSATTDDFMTPQEFPKSSGGWVNRLPKWTEDNGDLICRSPRRTLIMNSDGFTIYVDVAGNQVRTMDYTFDRGRPGKPRNPIQD